jgi:hypothetical protein
MFFYQRIMLSQMLWRLERSAQMLEGLTIKGKTIVIKKISKKPSKEMKDSINNFLEFFVIEPISLDPFGIMKKIEHMVNLEMKRFKYFVKGVAPDLNSEEQANVLMGLSAAISLNQIAKIVRHYVEMIRETKNLQLAMVLQMQIPLIEKLAKALHKGTEALTNGWPIGDSVGALVAAHMIGAEKAREIEEDTLLARKKIKGKEVLIIKATGPGGRLGYLGKAVDKIMKKEKIAKIITVDAAVKLEGEKTGSVAEGIGVAIGGVGVDRSYIENLAASKEIPLDTFVVKMSQEEAIQCMKNEILLSVGKVIKLVEDNISKTKGKVIVVGVGNSAGIGNNEKDAKEAEQLVKRTLAMLKGRKEEKKRRLDWLFGE